MGPAVVLGLLPAWVATCPRVVVVGCQPLTLADLHSIAQKESNHDPQALVLAVDAMTLDVADGTVTLAGESVFDIRDFGMEPPRILMLKVQPEVSVRVEIVAQKDS